MKNFLILLFFCVFSITINAQSDTEVSSAQDTDFDNTYVNICTDTSSTQMTLTELLSLAGGDIEQTLIQGNDANGQSLFDLALLEIKNRIIINANGGETEFFNNSQGQPIIGDATGEWVFDGSFVSNDAVVRKWNLDAAIANVPIPNLDAVLGAGNDANNKFIQNLIALGFGDLSGDGTKWSIQEEDAGQHNLMIQNSGINNSQFRLNAAGAVNAADVVRKADLDAAVGSGGGAAQNLNQVLATGNDANGNNINNLTALIFSDVNADGGKWTAVERSTGQFLITYNNGSEIELYTFGTDGMVNSSDVVRKFDLDAAIAGVNNNPPTQTIQQVLQAGNDANTESIIDLFKINFSDNSGSGGVWTMSEDANNSNFELNSTDNPTTRHTFTALPATEPFDVLRRADLDSEIATNFGKAFLQFHGHYYSPDGYTSNRAEAYYDPSDPDEVALFTNENNGFTFNTNGNGINGTSFTATRDMRVRIHQRIDVQSGQFSSADDISSLSVWFPNETGSTFFFRPMTNMLRTSTGEGAFGQMNGTIYMDLVQGQILKFRVQGGVDGDEYEYNDWTITIEEI